MVIFKQFYLNCLAHASYLVGDERARIAAVVDPQRDVDQYVAFADEHRLRSERISAQGVTLRSKAKYLIPLAGLAVLAAMAFATQG